MIVWIEDKYKTVDKTVNNGENNKTLSELQTEFHNTYNEIQQFKHDPSCAMYHKLYHKLEIIQAKRTKLAIQS